MDTAGSMGLTGFAIGSLTTWAYRRHLERLIFIWRHRFQIENNPVKMVLAVRTDLPMKTGKIASQCAHAAVSCFYATTMYRPHDARLWGATGQTKIVVQCRSEADLFKLQAEAKKYKLVSSIAIDAGRTQVRSGTKTVIGIGPGNAADIDKVTGHLKLF